MTWGNYKLLNPHLPNPQSIAVAKRDTNVLNTAKGSAGPWAHHIGISAGCAGRRPKQDCVF